MTKSVGVHEAKTQLSKLLAEVQQGEEVEITNRGTVVARLVPPASQIDKTRYSAFAEPGLRMALLQRNVDGLIVTGSETDVCVLATVLGAVDHGYRVILVADGVCSSSDEGHEALLKVYRGRYSLQIETADTESILSAWPKR